MVIIKHTFLVFLISRNFFISWPLNNPGLNCTGPLICEFFSINTLLHILCLVESLDGKLPIRRANYRTWGSVDFGISGRSCNQFPADTKGWLYIYSCSPSNHCSISLHFIAPVLEWSTLIQRCLHPHCLKSLKWATFSQYTKLAHTRTWAISQSLGLMAPQSQFVFPLWAHDTINLLFLPLASWLLWYSDLPTYLSMAKSLLFPFPPSQLHMQGRDLVSTLSLGEFNYSHGFN